MNHHSAKEEAKERTVTILKDDLIVKPQVARHSAQLPPQRTIKIKSVGFFT
jgi:hypothetical protein